MTNLDDTGTSTSTDTITITISPSDITTSSTLDGYDLIGVQGRSFAESLAKLKALMARCFAPRVDTPVVVEALKIPSKRPGSAHVVIKEPWDDTHVRAHWSLSQSSKIETRAGREPVNPGAFLGAGMEEKEIKKALRAWPAEDFTGLADFVKRNRPPGLFDGCARYGNTLVVDTRTPYGHIVAENISRHWDAKHWRRKDRDEVMVWTKNGERDDR